MAIVGRIEVENEELEGHYEQIDNILNTLFTMEYNMSYSIQLHKLLCRLTDLDMTAK